MRRQSEPSPPDRGGVPGRCKPGQGCLWCFAGHPQADDARTLAIRLPRRQDLRARPPCRLFDCGRAVEHGLRRSPRYPQGPRSRSRRETGGCRGKWRCAHLIAEGGGVDRLRDREFEAKGSADPANHSASARAVPSPCCSPPSPPHPYPLAAISARLRPRRRQDRESKGTLRIPGWRPPRAGHPQRVPASPRGRHESRSDSRSS